MTGLELYSLPLEDGRTALNGSRCLGLVEEDLKGMPGAVGSGRRTKTRMEIEEENWALFPSKFPWTSKKSQAKSKREFAERLRAAVLFGMKTETTEG